MGRAKFAEWALTHAFTLSLRITCLAHHPHLSKRTKRKVKLLSELSGKKCLNPWQQGEQQMTLAMMFQTDTFLTLTLIKRGFLLTNPMHRQMILTLQKENKSGSLTHIHTHNHSFVMAMHRSGHTFILQVLPLGPLRFSSPSLVHCCWDTGEQPPT